MYMFFSVFFYKQISKHEASFQELQQYVALSAVEKLRDWSVPLPFCTSSPSSILPFLNPTAVSKPPRNSGPCLRLPEGRVNAISQSSITWSPSHWCLKRRRTKMTTTKNRSWSCWRWAEQAQHAAPHCWASPLRRETETERRALET